MFHKALWMRNYKQGKVAIWLMWGISLLRLPIAYTESANHMTQMLLEWEDWEYNFSFIYEDTLLPLGGLVILLACLLIGGERTNQGMDSLFAMPFKRRDIFLSKWLIGAVTITAMTLVNMIFMYIIQNTTIHGDYQTFTPFLDLFLFMFVGLLAVYSVALFVGTVTGGLVSQSILTFIVTVLPYGLSLLIIDAIEWHGRASNLWNVNLWTMYNFFRNISLLPATLNLRIQYSFWNEFGFQTETINLFHDTVSLTTYISLLIYLVVTFPLGLFLFTRTPGENNGKIILYKKLEPIFLWCTIISFALLGGSLGAGFLWDTPLIGFYIGLIVLGFICYIFLNRLMKKPLKLKKV